MTLNGCNNNSGGIVEVERFNEILSVQNAKKYDLRDYDECGSGHINGFACIMAPNIDGSIRSIEDIIEIIKFEKKNQYILLICNDGSKSQYICNSLKKSGYRNVYYFEGGYDNYVTLMGDQYKPEIGCNTGC